MTTFKDGVRKGQEARDKITRGYKRFGAFAHASALAVLVTYAGQNVLAEVRANDKDAPTIVLLVSTVLIGLTALYLYVKFFTDEN